MSNPQQPPNPNAPMNPDHPKRAPDEKNLPSIHDQPCLPLRVLLRANRALLDNWIIAMYVYFWIPVYTIGYVVGVKIEGQRGINAYAVWTAVTYTVAGSIFFLTLWALDRRDARRSHTTNPTSPPK